MYLTLNKEPEWFILLRKELKDKPNVIFYAKQFTRKWKLLNKKLLKEIKSNALVYTHKK